MRRSRCALAGILLLIAWVPAADAAARPKSVRTSPPAAAGTVARLLERNDADSALRVVSTALKEDSASPDLWLALADVQHARGQRQAEIAALRQVLRLQPRSVPAYLGLADNFLNSGAPDSAAPYVRAALDQGKDQYPQARYLAGRLWEARGQADSAIVWYRRAWEMLQPHELF